MTKISEINSFEAVKHFLQESQNRLENMTAESFAEEFDSTLDFESFKALFSKKRNRANPISLEAYRDAIEALMQLTKFRETSAAKVAAQILLSTYNGFYWQLSIPELGLLDDYNYDAAITVIRGRIEVNVEPQRIIDDGDARFGVLWNDWIHLHVKNRGKD